MTTSLIVLELAGAVVLLIWAVQMVRTGVERAFGPELKDTLRRAGNTRLLSAGIGIGLAVVLQSSTAVAMLSAGFVASGLLTVATGLGLMLGADLGSAIVVQALSLDLVWLIPVLLIAGGGLFLKSKTTPFRQSGRILLGIAFVLLSLKMIGEATTPLKASDLLPEATAYLSDDVITAFLLGAVFTWMVHSSIASILLIMSLAAQALIPLELGVSLVLGANLGSGLIAMGLARGLDPEARRVPAGNLIYRGFGAVLFLSALTQWPGLMTFAGTGTDRQLVNLHLAFNALLLVACLPSVPLMEMLLRKVFPVRKASDQDNAGPSALDRATLNIPKQALASATRELLRMGTLIDQMLQPLMGVFETGDRDAIAHCRANDARVRKIQSDLKLFLAELTRKEMRAEEADRSMELASFGVNLEHVSSLIANNLMRLAEQKRDQKLVFSEEGLKDLVRVHDRVTANFQLALNVAVSGDPDVARQLVEEKEKLRELEQLCRERHLERLRSHISASIESSSIHLETVRDLKQINTLVTAVAHPILRMRGDLLESRLADAAE